MDIGDRVQLKFLHKPIGTIISIIPGSMWQGVVLVEIRYQVRWDDGEWGTASASELLYLGKSTDTPGVFQDSFVSDVK